MEYILGFPAELLDEWEAYLALEDEAIEAAKARAERDAHMGQRLPAR